MRTTRLRFTALVAVLGIAFATLVATPAAAAVPVITAQPVAPTGYPGEGLIVSIGVESDSAYAVTWQVYANFGGGQQWHGLATGDTAALYYPGSVPLETRAEVTNADGTVYSNTFQPTLLDAVAPSITDQPESVTVVEGQDAIFTADASGPPSPSVQWYQRIGLGSWTEIAGATGRTYTRTAVPLSDDGLQIRALFENSAGGTYTVVANLTVEPAPYAPVITTQPVDAEVYYEGAAYFEAAAVGIPVPSVQWEWSSDGVTGWAQISGATGDSVLLEDILAPASVRAVFTNSQGSTTTETAAITLYAPGPPRIQRGPDGLEVDSGEDAVFTVEPMGLPVATLQWYALPPGGDWDSDWTAIAGATGRELVLDAVTLADDGTWVMVVLSNEFGTEESIEAELDVRPISPTVTLDPVDTAPHGGGSGAWVTTFTAAAYADPVAAVSWERNDGSGWVTIAGESTGTLTITSPVGTQVRARFENSVGSTYSDSATVLEPDAPTIDWQSAETEIGSGEMATFTVSTTGLPTPAVTWERFDGATWVPIDGATGATYTTGPLLVADSGLTIRAVATNLVGTAPTDGRSVTVRPKPPAITVQPSDVAVVEGEDATFTVQATGDPLTIQWQTAPAGTNDWSDVPGATGANFVIHDVGLGDDGLQVRAIVTGDNGLIDRIGFAVAAQVVQLTSEVAVLSVAAAPVVPALAATGAEASGPLMIGFLSIVLLLAGLGVLAAARFLSRRRGPSGTMLP